MKTMQFTHIHVVPNIYSFVYSVEHKSSYFITIIVFINPSIHPSKLNFLMEFSLLGGLSL